MRQVFVVCWVVLLAACSPTESSPAVGRTKGQRLAVPSDTLVATEVTAEGHAVGNLRGNAGVSSDGSATYSVPLWVSPGRAGIQPMLALNYQSNRANGLVGVGWSLSGLSQISRCPKNIAQDGVVLPVTFTAADAFCIDGQRLVAVTGQYGASNTEYRTETDGFSKVVSLDADANGPVSFRVYMKDGRIMTYGAINNSTFVGARIRVTPEYEKNYTTTRDAEVNRYAWGLAQVEDRSGNMMSFLYDPPIYDPADSSYEHLLKQISYTASVSGSHYATRFVAFEYEPRPALDMRTVYVAGFKTKSSRRLKTLRMKGPNSGGATVTLRSYVLSYAQEVGSGKSLLTSLQECDWAGRCKRPMSFEWTQPSNTFTTVDAQILDASIHAEFANLQPNDMNGDGLDDLIYRTSYPQNFYRWVVRYSTGSTYFLSESTALPATCWYSADGEEGRWYDLNLDGLLDVSIVKKDGCILTPPMTLMNYVGGTAGFSLVDTSQAGKAYIADLDGDGLMEVVQVVYDSNGKPRLSSRSNYQGVLQPFQEVHRAPDEWRDNLQYVLNQDGLPRASILFENKRVSTSGGVETVSNRFWSLQQRNGSFEKTETTLLLPYVDEKAYLFADINGDGLPDAILNPGVGGDIEIMMNTGNGFAAPVAQALPAFAKLSSWESDNGVRVLDYNHDGRQDLLLMGKKGTDRTNFVLLLSNGINFDPQILSAFTVSADAGNLGNKLSQVFDMNGDGLADFTQPVNGHLLVYRRDGVMPGLLTRVKDSLNSSTTFVYKPITDASVHARGTNCGYPRACARQGQWVVHESQADAGEGQPLRFKRYFYEDGRIDAVGRGWLGFKAMTVTDIVAGTETRTEYDNATRVGTFYPYASTPVRERVRTNTGDGRTTVRERTIHYRSALRGGTVAATQVLSLFPVDGIETEREHSIDGGPNSGFARTTQTHWTYDDAFGNLTDKTQSTVGGDSVAWHAVYSNSPANWLVGLPTSVAESSTVNGQLITRTKTLTYDSTGRLQSETVELGDPELERTTTFILNADGLATEITQSGVGGVTPRTTTIAYSGTDQMYPGLITNAAGHATEYAYEPGFGFLAAARDARGVLTRWKYDAFGRLRMEDAPDLADTEVHYRQFLVGTTYTSQVSTSVAGGQTVTVDYDRLGRSVQSRSSAFNGATVVSKRRFDHLGRLAEAAHPDPQGGTVDQVTSYQYDLMGRTVKVTNPDGSLSTTRYRGYPEGFEITSDDENGNTRRFLHDVNGRVIKSMERKSFTSPWLETRYEYGPFGLLRKTRDPLNNESVLGYDRLGRRTSLQDPDSGLSTTHYTALGEIERTVDGSNVVTTYVRDDLGRPVTVTSSRDGIDHFTWDVQPQGPNMPGRLLRSLREGVHNDATDDIAVAYQYDTLGRPALEQWSVEGRTYAINRTYDGYSRPLTLEYPTVAGARLRLGYEYTSLGFLQSVKDLGTHSERWRVTGRNAVGQLTSESLGNGVVTQRLYDSMGRLRFINTQKGTLPLQQLAYEYQPNGNISNRHDRLAKTTEDFHYDGMNRLDFWTVFQNCRAVDQSYAYDDLGNLLGWTSSLGVGASESFTYGEGPAGPHALTGGQAGSYGYDASGNQTSAPGRTVEYTGFHLPSRITDAQQSVTYRYSASNARTVKRHSDGTVTTYVGGLYEERREPGGGVTHSFHVGAAGRGIAEVTWRVDADPSKPLSTQWRYLHADNLGSTESVTDEGGNLVGRMKYEPFGARRHPLDLSLPWKGTSREVRQGFTGHEQDTEFDLVNMQGRIYDPRLGRFLSPDPVVQAPLLGQSFNRYSYVLNNPLRYTDPSGFMAMDTIYYYDSWYGQEVGRSPSSWSSAPETNYDNLGFGSGVFSRAPNYDPVLPLQLNFGNTSYTTIDRRHERSNEFVPDGTTQTINLIETVVFHQEDADWLLARLKQGLGGGGMGIAAGLLPAGHLLPIPEGQTTDFYHGYSLGLGLISLGELYQSAGMLLAAFTGEVGGGALTLTGAGAPAGVPLMAVSTAAVAGALVVGAEGIADGAKALAVMKSPGGAKRGPKTDPSAPHNTRVREVAGQVSDGRVVAGGGELPERLIPTPDGLKAGRRPDILVEKPDGSVYGINVGREAASGAPVRREVEAIYDLESADVPMHFVPYFP